MRAEYARALRATREQAGMTQIQVARAAGLSVGSYKKYELLGADDVPNAVLVQRIAAAMTLTVPSLRESHDGARRLDPAERLRGDEPR